MYIPDFTKISWPMNVALMGAVFSVFALIYRPEYIYYGFITFVYGIISHINSLICDTVSKDKGWKFLLFYLVQFILTTVWLGVLIWIYIPKYK